jgi:hypothetical protein
MQWREITHERYMYALEVLPPAVWLAKGFLLGEPETHRKCHVCGAFCPAFTAYVEKNGTYYESAKAMTALEFHKLDVSSICATS